MRLPRVRFTMRRVAYWVAMVAVLCALPIYFTRIFEEDSIRRGALYLEKQARDQQKLAATSPKNAAEHLQWHAEYAREAAQLRGQIGWGRLTSLAFVGSAAGLLAWQFRQRWLAAGLTLAVMTALLLCSELNARLPWEARIGLGFWAIILLVPSAIVLLLLVAVGAGPLFSLRRGQRTP
jgi:hypothetical protein